MLLMFRFDVSFSFSGQLIYLSKLSLSVLMKSDTGQNFTKVVTELCKNFTTFVLLTVSNLSVLQANLMIKNESNSAKRAKFW